MLGTELARLHRANVRFPACMHIFNTGPGKSPAHLRFRRDRKYQQTDPQPFCNVLAGAPLLQNMRDSRSLPSLELEANQRDLFDDE